MKKADINIVDEAKDTDISLSTENIYPAGEEPDSDSLTLEDAHLTTRRVQGSSGRTSDIHIVVPDDIVADIQAEVGQYLDLNDELRLPLARVSGSAYDIASLLNDKLMGSLSAKFTSDGYVMPKELTDDMVYYHTVSIDGVSALREQILEALEAKKLQVMVDHDFLTNIVIGYLKSALPVSRFSYEWDIDDIEIDDGVDTVTVNIKGAKKKSDDDADKEAAVGWNLAELTEPGISSNQMTELNDRFSDPNMWESPRDRIASDFNPHAVTSGLSPTGDKVVVVNENRNKYIYNLSVPGYRLTMFGDSIPTLTTAAVSVDSLYEDGADTLSNDDAYLGDHLKNLVRSQSKKSPAQQKSPTQQEQKPSLVKKVKDFFSPPGDPNNKAGEVEAPYSQGEGPMGTRFDDVTEKGYNIVKGADLMPGGVGDDLPDSLFNPIELSLGIRTEAEEHGLDEARATEVAKDHLTEDPEYYSKHAQVDWKNPTPEQLAIREKYKNKAKDPYRPRTNVPYKEFTDEEKSKWNTTPTDPAGQEQQVIRDQLVPDTYDKMEYINFGNLDSEEGARVPLNQLDNMWSEIGRYVDTPEYRYGDYIYFETGDPCWTIISKNGSYYNVYLKRSSKGPIVSIFDRHGGPPIADFQKSYDQYKESSDPVLESIIDQIISQAPDWTVGLDIDWLMVDGQWKPLSSERMDEVLPVDYAKFAAKSPFGHDWSEIDPNDPKLTQEQYQLLKDREKYKGLAGESLHRHHELPTYNMTEADLPPDRQVELDTLKEVFPASGPAQAVRSRYPTTKDVKRIPYHVAAAVYKYGDALVVPLEDPTDFWIEWPNNQSNYLDFGIDPTDGKQVVEWTSDTGAELSPERLQTAKPLNDPWLEPLLDQMGSTIRSNAEGLVKSFDGKWVVQRLGPAQDVRVEDPTDPWYFSSQFPHYIGRKRQAADTPIPESWKRPIDIEEWNNPETPADQASSVIREQFMPDMSPDADISEVEYELPVPGSLDLPADMYNQPIVYMYKGLAWNTPMTAYNPSVSEYRVYDLSNRRFAWLEFSMNRGRPVAEMGRSEYIDPTAIVFEFKQLPSNDALIEKFIDDIGPNELLTVRASQLFTIKDGKWVLIDTAEQAEYLSRDDINILASTHARQAKIIKRKDKWLVTTESGDRVLGTHNTKAEAQAQLSAIEISKHKKGVDKDAVGLIEGPAIDENAYGADFSRADQAIPRPPGKDKLIHRK